MRDEVMVARRMATDATSWPAAGCPADGDARAECGFLVLWLSIMSGPAAALTRARLSRPLADLAGFDPGSSGCGGRRCREPGPACASCRPAGSRLSPLRHCRLALRFPRQSIDRGDRCRSACARSAAAVAPWLRDVSLHAFRPARARDAFCALASLLPGTLPADTNDDGTRLVHCLDVDQPVAAQLAAEEALFMPSAAAMAEFLIAAAGFVLAMVALGLVRILRGPANADRMMAAQLLGTGGIAALLAAGRGHRDPGRGGCRADAGPARRLRRRRVRQQRPSFRRGRARRNG